MAAPPTGILSGIQRLLYHYLYHSSVLPRARESQHGLDDIHAANAWLIRLAERR
jgi:hypothetical protein